MSEIQKTLEAATEVGPSKRKNETITSPDYMQRLIASIAELPDEEWKKLPLPAQDWYNAGADALEAKKPIPEYADMPQPETTGRRRVNVPETAAPAANPAKGDTVTVVTKRGKEYNGKIVEIDDKGLVLEVDGKDVELDFDRIESTTVAVGGASAQAEPELPADPEVGDTVQVVTKRGKTIMGIVQEIDETEIILKDTTGEVHELAHARLESVLLKAKGAAGVGTPADKPKAADAPKGDGAVSVTMRMREMICDNLDATKEQITAMLKKEELNFKGPTLDLIYSEVKKIVGMLRERKLMK